MHRLRSTSQLVLASTLALALGGCVLWPKGSRSEQANVDEAGRVYQQPFGKRQLPEVPAEPAWQDVLHRAFLANGDLEAAYFQWSAAMARVQQMAAYPTMNFQLGFEYMFSSENMKSWDRTTIEAKQEGLAFPTKVAKAGTVALAEARAAGARFRAAKFDLQRRVLTQWVNYALMAERVRITQDNVRLLKLLVETAANRVRAGAQQQDLLKAQIELELADNELATMKSELPQMRAMLNAMLGRPADAALPAPNRLPGPRSIPADDARLLALGVEQNPELAALARQVEGGRNALELARMQYLPDFELRAGFTGGIEQFLGTMITLPTAIPMIRGAIKEARADLGRMEAMQRQTRLDRSGQFVATLYALRNSERQVQLFRRRVLPAAELVLENSRQAYSAGSVGFVELIDSQRTLLDVKLMLAEAAAARERYLVELEALAGTDIETIALPATMPATRPVGDAGDTKAN